MNRNTGLRKKSVLFHFFLSYLCILAFTLVTSSLLHYQTINILKKENNRANDAILKQFRNALDDKFIAMTELAVQAYIGAESELYATRGSQTDQYAISSYARYRICKNLNKLNTAAQENIENIFIYYHNAQYIAGLSSSVPSDIFYQAYYQTNDFSANDWNNALQTPTGFTAFPSKSGSMSIAFVYSPFQAGGEGGDKVFVCFNPARLQKILADSRWESNGAFLVFNAGGVLLTSTDPAYNDMDLSSYFHMSGFFNMEHKGEEYTCKITQSNQTKCFYASVTPKALAIEPVSNSRKMVLLFSIIFVLAGLLISYMLSRRNYAPLKRLVDWVNQKAVYDPQSFEKGNEIDILERILHLSFEEQEKLIEQIHNKKNGLVLSSIRDLLYGTSSQDYSIQDVFLKNDIPLLSDQFAVILIYIEEKYSNNAEVLSSRDFFGTMITNVMIDLSRKEYQCFVVPIEISRYACLVNFSPLTKTDIMQQALLSIAEEVKTSLETNFGICLTISLSKLHTGIDGIHQAYQEALYAMEYRLTIGSNQIIPYQEPLKGESIYTFTFKTDHFINLFLKEPRDSNQVELFVSDLFAHRNISSHISPAIAKDFIYDVAGSLSKAVNDMIPDGDMKWKMGIFDRLIQSDTLARFRSELISILNEYQEYLHKKPDLYSISAQVKIYISQNYSDPDLSLNVLSSEFNLSPSHLSRTFKEGNGISISDYISICRINSAKELLKNTDKTIQQIAGELGFLSSSVFIRVFKKTEGVTPGSYRKLVTDGET